MFDTEPWMRRTGRLAVIVAMFASVASAHAAPTWTPVFPIGFDSYGATMSTDGTIVFSGLASIDGSMRVAVQIRPPGGPLGPVQALSGPGASSLPALAAGPDGRIVAAWVDGFVVNTAVLPAGATSFGDVVAMPPTGDSPGGGVAVAVDQAGDAFVLWTTTQGPTQSTLRAGVRPGSGGAPTAQILEQVTVPAGANTLFFGLRIAASDAGGAIAAWQRYDMTFMPFMSTTTSVKAALHPPGQLFGSPVVLDSGMSDSMLPDSYADAPSVAMTPSGDAGVIWGHRNYTGGGTDTFVVRFRAGTAAGGFAAGTQVPSTGGGSFPDLPAVAMRPDGTAVAAWRGMVSGTYRPQVAIRAAGGSFSAPQTITTSGDAASSSTLTASRSGQVALVFSTYAVGVSGMQAAVAPPGGVFAAPTPLASNLSSLNGQAAASGPDGDAVATWRHFSGGAYVTQAVGYDVSGPRLLDLQLPGSGTAGAPLAFSVRPVDIWAPLASITWSFGDGAAGDGASVSHTYASPGERTVGVTATDAFGNSSSRSSPVSIGAPTTPPATSGADRIPPRVTAFGMTRRTFAVGSRPTALVARVRRGTVFRYTLSERAAVAIAIGRESPGLRKGKRCVRPTAALRKSILRLRGTAGLRRARCTRLQPLGSLKRTGIAGANSVSFSGRLGKKALKLGPYRATLTATDAAGNASARPRVRFRIVRAR